MGRTPYHGAKARGDDFSGKRERRKGRIRMEKKAFFIKESFEFTGTAKIYRMEPPHEGHEFVVASAAHVPFSGCETFLFPCDKDGSVLDWCELDGSERDIYDCEAAIRNAGYDIQ